MKRILFFLLFLAVVSCEIQPDHKRIKTMQKSFLDINEAYKLAQLPLKCINTEYPNKLNQTLGSKNDIRSPKELHPAFYGCFDWHSSVHGHWSLVSLLKQYPNLKDAEKMKEKLLKNISKQHIESELLYFEGQHNQSFERTYGWAWLLKLAEEIHTWDDPVARTLEENLQPLTDFIAQKYLDFLPKLRYPIRVGEHTNTAFGLSFAWDYARTLGKSDLATMIRERAKDFYLNDKACPLAWEPSGFDFLSPCFQEAALMKRVLPSDKFQTWFAAFLPNLKEPSFQLKVGEVSDRKDGKLVHIDGLNFSRAWSLYEVVQGNSKHDHLKIIADQHIQYSLPNLVGDSYEGGHWLGSFAIYALNAAKAHD